MTTAASIWVAASLGMAVGFGYWLAVFVAVVVVVVLVAPSHSRNATSAAEGTDAKPTFSRTSFRSDGGQVAIVTDSTSDLPPQLARQRSIRVVPLTLNFEGRSLLDGVDIRPSEFYRKLPTATTHPTTSQPSPGQFADVYNELLADHGEVVSIHISEKLSGTYASAVQAAEMTDSKRVRVIDSHLVSMSLGLLVLAASQMAAEEKTRSPSSSARAQCRIACRLSSRSPRSSSCAAAAGSAAPAPAGVGASRSSLFSASARPCDAARARAHVHRALNRIVELTREVDAGKGLCVIVGHGDAEADAEQVARELEPVAETLMIQPLGPVVGAHAGPGVVGVGCYPADLLPLGIKSFASAPSRA